MEENLPLLLGVAGLGIVCSGLLLIVLLLVLRVTGRNVVSLFTMFMRSAGDEKEEPLRLPRRKANLRAKVEAVDFEQALAAQALKQDEPPLVPPDQPVELPPSRFDQLNSRDRLRRRRDTQHDPLSDDMMMGGLLDVDDDGDPGY